ncbi:hypothetical protein M514_23295 [Trichuris suis]|uniref:Uncharacterized protein n=1 Tax=Trichuris suis TaxID=68888 RepID=A0A085N4Q2_9BILA|nr:hypothetical protein M514_23295 [Trichuris suis]
MYIVLAGYQQCFAAFTNSGNQATFININAELSGLFWARHQREVRRSPPGLYACKPLHPTDFGMDRSCQLKP